MKLCAYRHIALMYAHATTKFVYVLHWQETFPEKRPISGTGKIDSDVRSVTWHNVYCVLPKTNTTTAFWMQFLSRGLFLKSGS